ALFYALAAALIALAGWSAGAGLLFALGLLAFAAHLAWQIARLDVDDPIDCLVVFKSNRDAGLILFAGLVLDAALRAYAASSLKHRLHRIPAGCAGALGEVGPCRRRARPRPC